MRSNRILMVVQGVLATAVLVTVVLVLQASWTAAKSAWLKTPSSITKEAPPYLGNPADNPRQQKSPEPPPDRI